MVILNYWWQLLIAGLGIYLLCNINFAVIFSKKFKHRDIRQCGSGNPGTANVVRTFGLKMGVVTFICDFGKGAAAALIGKYLFSAISGNASFGVFAGFFLALCAVLGHIYPVFYKFKGGKGVATSLGALLVLNPIFTLICFAFALVIILLTDKTSIFALLGTTAQFIYTAVVSLTNATLISEGVAIPITVVMGLIWIVIIVAHRGNIKRLLTGKENNTGIKNSLFKRKEKTRDYAENKKVESQKNKAENNIE